MNVVFLLGGIAIGSFFRPYAFFLWRAWWLPMPVLWWFLVGCVYCGGCLAVACTVHVCSFLFSVWCNNIFSSLLIHARRLCRMWLFKNNTYYLNDILKLTPFFCYMYLAAFLKVPHGLGTMATTKTSKLTLYCLERMLYLVSSGWFTFP